MWPPGYHHNGFMATPELGHRMYCLYKRETTRKYMYLSLFKQQMWQDRMHPRKHTFSSFSRLWPFLPRRMQPPRRKRLSGLQGVLDKKDRDFERNGKQSSQGVQRRRTRRRRMWKRRRRNRVWRRRWRWGTIWAHNVWTNCVTIAKPNIHLATSRRSTAVT